MPLTRATPVEKLDGVRLTKKQQEALETIGCTTVGSLLTHYPRRYEDRRRFDGFPTQPTSDAVCLHGKIIDQQTKRFGRRSMVEVVIEDTSSPEGMRSRLTLRWFNMPWLGRQLAVGQNMVAYGRSKTSGKRLVMDHPDYEIIEPGQEDKESLHLGRITPVYPGTAGIQQRHLRELIAAALAANVEWTDIVPASQVEGDYHRARAIADIHFPESEKSWARARKYLAFEECLGLQINVARQRHLLRDRPGRAREINGKLWADFEKELPFQLTGAQQRAIAEIRDNLRSPQPMNRLLQGDVGSGKTLVAMAAMLDAVESGCQAALMAPTQILAEQHYLTFRRMLEPHGIRVSLRTANRRDDGFLPLLAGGDEPQMLIGTHALLYESAGVDQLGLAVIDEQHKFGVLQRAKLVRQGDAPDVLVMTATPIPRTLCMTVYGDLDVSVLDEMPKGRGKIITAVRSANKTPAAAEFLREHIEAGRQAYIVYPLIDESDKLKLKAATEEFKAWGKRLSGIDCALLHGRMASEEKDAVMSRFRNGDTQVLIATTVVEVGVDVPNANIMYIYNAGRFGLAQLHQLRGRIGRGEHKSYCVLMTDGKKDENEAMDKLNVLVETTDGFRIAEEDLKLRGPGDVLGTAQSGLPGLRLANVLTDTKLLVKARKLAESIIADDPDLKKTENAGLREFLMEPGDSLAQVG